MKKAGPEIVKRIREAPSKEEALKLYETARILQALVMCNPYHGIKEDIRELEKKLSIGPISMMD